MTVTAASVETKVNRSEWFAGFACLLSAGTLIFSAGILYGQTQDNSRRIGIVEGKLDQAIPDIAAMKADIKFLVRSEERRQGIRQTDPSAERDPAR